MPNPVKPSRRTLCARCLALSLLEAKGKRGMAVFDDVSSEYGKRALVQQRAAEKLIALLGLRPGESVLDVACGPGNITTLLMRAVDGGRIVGTDISGGMIEKASAVCPGAEFRRVAAERLDYRDEFDVVFCNSALQWFSDAPAACRAMFEALAVPGRAGVACPSTPDFSPAFNMLARAAGSRLDLAPTFSRWRPPWFHLQDLPAYRAFFEGCGFTTSYMEMAHEVSSLEVMDAFEIWRTGAARGFLSAEYYDVEPPEDYGRRFNAAVLQELEGRARAGRVDIDFNRLYYVGTK